MKETETWATKLQEVSKDLEHWFVKFLWERTMEVKSVVFGYGKLLEIDCELMDSVLELKELVGT